MLLCSKGASKSRYFFYAKLETTHRNADKNCFFELFQGDIPIENKDSMATKTP